MNFNDIYKSFLVRKTLYFFKKFNFNKNKNIYM